MFLVFFPVQSFPGFLFPILPFPNFPPGDICPKAFVQVIYPDFDDYVKKQNQSRSFKYFPVRATDALPEDHKGYQKSGKRCDKAPANGFGKAPTWRILGVLLFFSFVVFHSIPWKNQKFWQIE